MRLPWPGLKMVNIPPGRVGYINARHGTGYNDAMGALAVKAVFGMRRRISSTKA